MRFNDKDMNCLGICSECEYDCELREEEFKSEDKQYIGGYIMKRSEIVTKLVMELNYNIEWVDSATDEELQYELGLEVKNIWS